MANSSSSNSRALQLESWENKKKSKKGESLHWVFPWPDWVCCVTCVVINVYGVRERGRRGDSAGGLVAPFSCMFSLIPFPVRSYYKQVLFKCLLMARLSWTWSWAWSRSRSWGRSRGWRLGYACWLKWWNSVFSVFSAGAAGTVRRVVCWSICFGLGGGLRKPS